MQFITIYQGASGSGEEIGEAVAEALGYTTVKDEAVVEASRPSGIPEAKLAEIVRREPTWWLALRAIWSPIGSPCRQRFAELAGDRGIVYHGHLGHELIPKFEHVLKVLLTAPMEMRIAQVRAPTAHSSRWARTRRLEVDVSAPIGAIQADTTWSSILVT